MYLEFHGLTSRPFESSADPALFFPVEDACDALAGLEYTARVARGVAMLTGHTGSGKTLVSRVLAGRLGDLVSIVSIRHVPESPRALLRSVARGLGLGRELTERDDLLEAIESEISRRQQAGTLSLLVVDDADRLSDDVLAELRLLSDLETATGARMPMLIVGDCTLETRLTEGGLESLRQRVALAHQLRPLSAAETAEYLAHRLQASAAREQPYVRFDAQAAEAIHQVAGGVPRLVNIAADHCLLLAYVRCVHVIDAELVQAASMPLARRTDSAELSMPMIDEYRRAA